MNAQTIQDNVNQYRFGVLVGNSTQERFGLDLANRQISQKLPNSTTKDVHNPYSSAFNTIKDKKSQEETEFQKHVIFSNNGVQKHLLLGHGINDDDLVKKQLATTYDLSYNQKVRPQTQIYSQYEPGKRKKKFCLLKSNNYKDLTKTSREFSSNTIIEKNHQTQIPMIGDQSVYKTEQTYQHYDEFTQSYDANHTQIPLRK